jgi:hypothetical protein
MAARANSRRDSSDRDERGNADQSTPEKGRKTFPIPLTTALLEAAMHGISFATPGHRCGRSCKSLLEL